MALLAQPSAVDFPTGLRHEEAMMTVPSMQGKTVLITGATSGIGAATALGLARYGASLVLLCRDLSKGETTVAAIREQTGNPNIEVLQADLASQASLRAAATTFLNSGRPLHVLINNAGIVNTSRQLSADGLEEVFAVNHLAYFLLTMLLLERLKASAPSRIVNVASEAHKLATLNFADLGSERSYSTMRVYGQSKLANLMFTYELARRLQDSGVTVNAVHPGAVATGLGANNGRWARRLIGMLRPFFRTPEKGAATSIYVAAAPQLAALSGKYFMNCRERRSSKLSYDRLAQQRLWQVSEELTQLR